MCKHSECSANEIEKEMIRSVVKRKAETELHNIQPFFGLPFLPPEEVEDAFTKLISDCPMSDFSFSDYLLETYIIPDSKFNPTLWAGHPKDEPRTTNGAEAFHRYFNQQFYTPHPHIHQVLNYAQTSCLFGICAQTSTTLSKRLSSKKVLPTDLKLSQKRCG
ncbi:Uncharacterized protein FWK35_00017948 [Aphis craccivora]|uniref:MULE domain-containing protein n=1 Tax=Aphis craccivora TaxID=307492 RepID=A0A6G0YRL5_APHCR|nr:Uncharacterized protein FWK35_00017948 [Aphis craccivora]